jgi:cytochrome c
MLDRVGLTAIATALLVVPATAADGNVTRGSRFFQQGCAACHSLEPDRNMTGPSLARVIGRKAGTPPSFRRYSPALKSADVTWSEQTLDPWLADPAHFIPGNRMVFPGAKDAQVRADIIAYLKQGASQAQTPGAPTGGMAGMMSTQSVPNLKKLELSERVQAITYCQDTYTVTTADGKMQEFWERNLRFKTDSSEDGPEKGSPAIVGTGMIGDRASVIFAAPDEIGSLIKPQC